MSDPRPSPVRGDAHAMVWDLIRGPWQFAAVLALAQLGCFELLAHGPLPVASLASRCEADPDLLERLLRCAASIGLLAQPDPRRYALTSARRMLIPGVPGSMYGTVLATGERAAWQALTGLADTARTGEAAFTAQQEYVFHGYLAAHPASIPAFRTSRPVASRASLGRSPAWTLRAAQLSPTSAAWTAPSWPPVLAAHPDLHGILFNRALGRARDHLTGAALTGRAELVPGDVLDGPLPSASTYLLASVLNGHDDAEARVILGNIRAAATSGPRLILAGILLPGQPAPHIGCDLDVQMMALGTGQERTRDAYLELLSDAGFHSTEVIGTPYGLSIIDAQPASTQTTA